MYWICGILIQYCFVLLDYKLARELIFLCRLIITVFHWRYGFHQRNHLRELE